MGPRKGRGDTSAAPHTTCTAHICSAAERWGFPDSWVVCREMGYGGEASFTRGSRFGPASTFFHTNLVDCQVLPPSTAVDVNLPHCYPG